MENKLLHFEQRPFDEIRECVLELFPQQDAPKWDLLPDDISRLATSSGVALTWTPIPSWAAFEYGHADIASTTFLSLLFPYGIPQAPVLIVTDECWDTHLAYRVDGEHVSSFIDEIYPEIHHMDFFQPQDCIFLCRQAGYLAILHHEGHIGIYESSQRFFSEGS